MWSKFNQNIIFISDMHIVGDNPICRLDNLVETQKKKLKFIINFANKNNAIILSAGDQTDTPRNFISFYILSNALKKLKTEFHCCLGQHDKYMRTDNPNSIHLITKLKLANRLNSVPYEINGINIYGCDFGDQVPDPKTKNNILVVHESITTRELAIKHVDFIEAKEFLLKNSRYDMILCGDIHRRFKLEIDNRIILNSGPILRKEASEYFMDYKPSFYFLHNGKIDLIEIPHKEYSISRDHIELKEKRDKIMLNFDINKDKNQDIENIILSKINEDVDSEELKQIIFE